MAGSIDHYSEGVKFDGYKGTWYTISLTEAIYQGEAGAQAIDGSVLAYEKGDQVTLYLMEHEQYGDECAHLIVNSKGQIISDECYDDIDTYISSTLPEWELFDEE